MIVVGINTCIDSVLRISFVGWSIQFIISDRTDIDGFAMKIAMDFLFGNLSFFHSFGSMLSNKIFAISILLWNPETCSPKFTEDLFKPVHSVVSFPQPIIAKPKQEK